MSDATQGPGWWQASDGKWYPPEQHPNFTAPTEAADALPPTAAAAAVPPPPDATQAMPAVPPVAPAPGPPGPPVVGPPPRGPVGPPPPGGGRGKVIAIVAVLAAIAVVAALLLLNRDSGHDKVAASDSARTDQTDATDQTDSTDATTTTKKTTTTSSKTTTTKPTTTTTPAVDAAKLTAQLLTPQEMGDGLEAGTAFTPDSKNPEACGQPNSDTVIPPRAIVGRSGVQRGVRAVLEQVRAFADAATSSKAFDRFVETSSCTDGNAFDAQGKPVPIKLGPAQDVTGQVDGAKRAVAISATGAQFEALVIAVDLGGELVAFQFEAAAGAGTETVEARLPVVQAGVVKLLAG